jgi:hypothetical protein
MQTINYLFYRISDAYIRKWKDQNGYIHGAGIVLLMEILHIGSLLFIIAIFSKQFERIYFGSLKALAWYQSWTTIVILVLFIANITLFDKKKYALLSEYWKNEEPSLKKYRGRLVLLYILFNLLITIGLDICRIYIYN